MNKKLTIFQVLTAAIMLMSINFANAQQSGQNLTFSPTFEVATEGSHVFNLIYDLQPTLFIHENYVFLYGDNVYLIVECDAARTDQLYEEDDRFETVELIKIKLSKPEDAFSLDLSYLQSFSNLKYVQLIFEYAVCGVQPNNACLYNVASSYIHGGNMPVTVMFHFGLPG